MKKFKGFNEQQTQAIAKSLGFEGDITQFSSFLESNPTAADKFSRMSQKAQRFVEGPVLSMASGGLVTDPAQKPAENIFPFSQQSQATKDKVTSTQSSSTANVPAGALSQTSIITEQANQFIDPKTGQLNPSSVTAGTAQGPKDVTKPPASTMEASKVTPGVDQVANQAQAAQGTVSQQGQVQAQTFDPNNLAQLGLQTPQLSDAEKREATVQQQLTNLQSQFEGGQEPPWAKGVLRNVSAMMAARGIDSSSVTAMAATQAAMEAATAIATTDAQLLGNYNMANLDVKKAKMLSDAAAMSAMDMANLNNRQQAAVENARAFLEMDYKNLDNRQQTAMMAFQSRVNALLSDQAQENAAKQFNATSENQTNQFFSNLQASIESQRAEMANTMQQFNASLLSQREQFNGQMALEIASANTKWRQQITTTNNAAQNLNNQLNASTIARMNETAFNAMIQLERDEMNYVDEALTRAFTSGENALQRQNDVLIASMNRDAQQKLAKQGYEFQAGSSIGGALLGIGRDILSAGFDKGFSNLFSW